MLRSCRPSRCCSVRGGHRRSPRDGIKGSRRRARLHAAAESTDPREHQDRRSTRGHRQSGDLPGPRFDPNGLDLVARFRVKQRSGHRSRKSESQTCALPRLRDVDEQLLLTLQAVCPPRVVGGPDHGTRRARRDSAEMLPSQLRQCSLNRRVRILIPDPRPLPLSVQRLADRSCHPEEGVAALAAIGVAELL